MGKITKLTLYTDLIPTDTIVQGIVSDLHYIPGMDNTHLNQIKQEMTGINCILWPGDLIDDASYLRDKKIKQEFQDTLYNFSKGKKNIVSYGNHDLMEKDKDGIWRPSDKRLIKDTLTEIGFTVLENGEKITTNGIEYSALSPDFYYYEDKTKPKKLRESPEDYKKLFDEYYNPELFSKNHYSILLTHEPQSIIRLSKELGRCIQPNTNLVLSGHMHNGMTPKFLPLPRNSGIISPQYQPLPKYAKGTKKVGETTFFINGPTNAMIGINLANNLIGANAGIVTLRKTR